MQKLAKREEQIMQAVWKLGKAFIREIIEEMPGDRPHYNSVATIVKILEKKKFLKSEKFGNTFRYEPLVAYEDYKASSVDNMVKEYFNNSYHRMLTYFARKEKVSANELEEILQIIRSKNNRLPDKDVNG